jgi:hypothetical protein
MQLLQDLANSPAPRFPGGGFDEIGAWILGIGLVPKVDGCQLILQLCALISGHPTSSHRDCHLLKHARNQCERPASCVFSTGKFGEVGGCRHFVSCCRYFSVAGTSATFWNSLEEFCKEKSPVRRNWLRSQFGGPRHRSSQLKIHARPHTGRYHPIDSESSTPGGPRSYPFLSSTMR